MHILYTILCIYKILYKNTIYFHMHTRTHVHIYLHAYFDLFQYYHVIIYIIVLFFLYIIFSTVLIVYFCQIRHRYLSYSILHIYRWYNLTSSIHLPIVARNSYDWQELFYPVCKRWASLLGHYYDYITLKSHQIPLNPTYTIAFS